MELKAVETMNKIYEAQLLTNFHVEGLKAGITRLMHREKEPSEYLTH